MDIRKTPIERNGRNNGEREREKPKDSYRSGVRSRNKRPMFEGRTQRLPKSKHRNTQGPGGEAERQVNVR